MKNRIFTAILVIYLLVSPGPLGVRPAHAAVPLAAVAVGAMIAAAGVMVAGAGVYKPSSFSPSDISVDGITGSVNRKVVVARSFGVGTSTVLRGFASSYTLDGQAVYDWVKAHSPDFPAIWAAIQSAFIPPGALSTGDIVPAASADVNQAPWVITVSGSNPNALFTIDAGTSLLQSAIHYGVVDSSGIKIFRDAYNKPTLINADVRAYEPTKGRYTQYTVTAVRAPAGTVADYPVVPVIDKPVFAAAYPQTATGHDETDKLAAQNPAAIKSEPQPMTLDQIGEAIAQARKDMLESVATDAEAAAAADPTNTALQIAAQQARAAADQAAIEAQGKTAELESAQDTPKEESTTVPPTALPLAAAPPAIDFSPLYTVKDAVNTHYPFVLIGTLTSYFSCLVSDAQAPAFTWPFFGHDITLSLSAWDNFATLWRASLLFFFNGACIYAILRRWS